ncbi:MAG: hypothetical protein ACI8RE_000123 [Ilumatobacter sp.]|jgi:hypothetical protein
MSVNRHEVSFDQVGGFGPYRATAVGTPYFWATRAGSLCSSPPSVMIAAARTK